MEDAIDPALSQPSLLHVALFLAFVLLVTLGLIWEKRAEIKQVSASGVFTGTPQATYDLVLHSASTCRGVAVRPAPGSIGLESSRICSLLFIPAVLFFPFGLLLLLLKSRGTAVVQVADAGEGKTSVTMTGHTLPRAFAAVALAVGPPTVVGSDWLLSRSQ